MNMNNKYLSISFVFVIVALVIYQIHAQTAYEDEISALKESQIAALQTSRDTIAQLQLTVANMNKQLQGIQTTAGNNQPATVTGPNGATITIASAQANDPATAMRQRFQSMMSSPAIREATAKMQVNAVYGDFIRGLHLNAAEKESLSQIFAGSMNQKSELAAKLAAGTISKAEYDASIKNIDSKLRDSLSGYLYKDEMTAFDQYEATKDVRAAARQIDAQDLALQRAVPDLPQDSRKYVARVLAEAMSQTPPQLLAGAQNGQNISAMLEARNQQMDKALQRIQRDGALDGNQLSAVEDYINQQKAMQDMVGQMANSFLKK